MTRKIKAAELRVNWHDDGKGYLLSNSIENTSYPKFEDLAGAVADYLDLDVKTGFRPETMVKHRNMIVRVRRDLGEVADD